MVPLYWGDLGVDIFFVLSGFLIAFISFREHKKYGELDHSNFFRSRCLRIWPVMALYTLGVGVANILTGKSAKDTILSVFPPWIYINNFVGPH